MTKLIFRNNYVHLDFYYQGIMLGVIVNDEVLTIIIPFFALEVYLFMFKKSKKKTI